MDKINKPWYKKFWGVILLTGLALMSIILTALAFYFYDLVKSASLLLKAGAKYNLSGPTYEVSSQNNYWLGAAKPQITITEFADFACPYSKNSFPKIREIGLKYKNSVKIIYKDYPVREYSPELALAARCAGDQGLFWPMHDKLFINQGVNTADQLAELANQIGADINKFKLCISQQTFLPQIQKDYAEAAKLGIGGTPTWFINGHKVEGDMPLDVFAKIIEELNKNF